MAYIIYTICDLVVIGSFFQYFSLFSPLYESSFIVSFFYLFYKIYVLTYLRTMDNYKALTLFVVDVIVCAFLTNIHTLPVLWMASILAMLVANFIRKLALAKRAHFLVVVSNAKEVVT